MPEPNRKDVEVPENMGMNMTVRDLRPYYKGEAKDLVQEELLPHHQYQMGVVPKHLRRAAIDGAMSGVGAAVMGGGEVASAAYDSGMKTLSAPVRPDRLVDQANNVRELLEVARDPEAAQETANEALRGAGKSFGRLVGGLSSAVKPFGDTYRAYKYPASQTAEAAGKRLAKARRKRQRREQDSVSLYDRFVKPFREDARVSREVREQMDKGGPIQLNVPPERG